MSCTIITMPRNVNQVLIPFILSGEFEEMSNIYKKQKKGKEKEVQSTLRSFACISEIVNDNTVVMSKVEQHSYNGPHAVLHCLAHVTEATVGQRCTRR